MKITSLYALTAAGVIVGGFALTPAPAKAADLGGSGADLEERVAELEATVARKGNRKVSLELYGQVNRALMMWNDGKDSDSYVVDNNLSSTRIGVKGEGKIDSGLKSGFNIEFEFVDSASNAVSNAKLTPGGDEGKGETGPIQTRQAFFFIDSEKLGRVSLGQQNDATKDLTIINLSGAGVASDARTFWNKSFMVRNSAGGTTTFGTSKVKWGDIADGLDTYRADLVRYDSPSVYGFVLSTAWGENDMWDIALRYKKEWNSFRIAGGIGYYYNNDKFKTTGGVAADPFSGAAGDAITREEIMGSVSALHVPTGLYLAFSAGERFNQHKYASDGTGAATELKDANFWYLQGGIDRRFFSYGNTTLYGEYGNYGNFGQVKADLSSSDVNRWGMGVVQKFDAAALEVYGAYQHFDADLKNGGGVKQSTEAFDAGIVGARVKF